MKGSGILILILFAQFTAIGQVQCSALSNLLEQSPKKVENYFHKKGFSREGFHSTGSEAIFSKNEVKDSTEQNWSVQVAYQKDATGIIYRTSVKAEYDHWKEELKKIAVPFSKDEGNELFFDHKRSITIHCTSEKIDTTTTYILSAHKQQFPNPGDLQFAEDLLEIDAHVYLENIFGRQNVKEDHFYFSENLKKKCSIIFPNTSRQAIFLWNDEKHLKGLAFIIIGEYESKSVQNNQSPLTLAQWRSKQGISCGMNLKELEMINQKEISFYRWRTAQSGTLAKNSGEIDFSRVEIVLDCMNCSFVSSSIDKPIITSIEAAEQNQKWYVRSFAVVKVERKE